MADEGHEFSRRDTESNEEMAGMLFAKRRCCSYMPCFGSSGSSGVGLNWWQRMRMTENEEGWWARGINALKKVREWSEIVAGPRWKTFIRRFNRNKSAVRLAKFQYDPLSYALNFDEGSAQNANSVQDDYSLRNFSSRYASFPIPTKTSVDLGKDGPAILT